MTDLVLTVPFGLEPSIFPWGVEVLRSYLKYNKPELDVQIWNLRNEEQILVLFEEYRDCISKTISLLLKARRHLGQADPVHASYSWAIRSYYTAVMLKFGGNLFSILRSVKIPFDVNMGKRHEEHLKELKQIFESIIQSKTREYIGGQRRVVFGISIYDYTLFESMYLASVIRRVQNGVSIIVGGDALTVPTASNIVERNKDIDGAVLGFGESTLSDIMQSFSNGTEIRHMQLDGLMNARNISRYLSLPDVEGIAAQQSSIIRHQMPSYVQFEPEKRTIYILARRGCGWGRCTFCKNTIKKVFIDANLTAVKRDIGKILDELSVLENVNESVHVQFSAENNVIEFVINLLDWLSSQAQTRKMKFNVWFWMTVQQFSRDVAHKLIALKRTGAINLNVSVALESLNPVSLRNMRKGISPLQGLKALKTLHDLGGNNRCYYFTFFPLDNLDGIAKEYYFMRNSLHLISAPRTILDFSYYYANHRDAISRNPKKYGIVLNPFKDIWLDKAFNLDLPWCCMAVDYSIVSANSREAKIVYSWFRILRKVFSIMPHKKQRTKPSLLFLLFIALGALPEILHHVVAQAVFSDFSYLKRNWVIINLFRRIQRSNTRKWDEKWDEVYGRSDSRMPCFFLKDSRLIKKYPWPFREEWSIELNPEELEVLRYLYNPRKYDDVVAEFKMKYSMEAIGQVLDRHFRLGSILRHENMLMSIFHDPGFLETQKEPIETK